MDLDGQRTFSDKVIVVTGAAGGIGEAIARAFASLGGSLILVDVTAGEVMDGERWVIGDLTEAQTVDDVVGTVREEYGRIDVLVNAAGIQLRGAAADVEQSGWQRLVDVNLSAAYALCRRFSADLSETRGAIVNVSSLSADRAIPGIVAYGATKAALSQLSRGLAVELGPRGIRVNAVAPGYIVTPMTEANLRRAEVHERVMSRLPLGRLGNPGDVADIVTFLASEQARYVTGVVLPVDGGYSVT